MNISPYILVIGVSWVVAQGAKYIIMATRERSLRGFRQLYLSGNMPSAHSTTVASMATVVGLYNGFDSALFGIALTLAGVVMYDAVMVRRSVGEQGAAIQAMIKLAKNGLPLPRAAKGHKPFEVLVGAALGVIIGVVVYIATI